MEGKLRILSESKLTSIISFTSQIGSSQTLDKHTSWKEGFAAEDLEGPAAAELVKKNSLNVGSGERACQVLVEIELAKPIKFTCFLTSITRICH